MSAGAPLTCISAHPPRPMDVAVIYDPGEDDPELVHVIWECGSCGARIRHDGPLEYDPEPWTIDSTVRRPG